MRVYPFFFLFLLFCLTVGTGCGNELELNAPAKDIPVVYGILSKADEEHFIRIEKAFIDDQNSALELAKDPEQLYFDDLSVSIIAESAGTPTRLQRVNGEDYGRFRESGTFATSPNILYLATAEELNLQADERYRLEVRLPGSDELLTSASTSIVNDLRLNRPIGGSQKPPLRIDEGDNEIDIVWGADETAFFFDVTMIIHYEEFTQDNPGERTSHSVAWAIVRGQTAERGANRAEPEGIEFYRFLATAIPDNNAVLRTLTSIDLRIDAGGEELFNYINVGQANTGITSSQVIPNYTNLSSGLGIFGSRNTLLEKGFFIDANTRESLRNSEWTRHLNFQ